MVTEPKTTPQRTCTPSLFLRRALLGTVCGLLVGLALPSMAQNAPRRGDPLDQKVFKLFQDSESIFAANKLYAMSRGGFATDPSELVPYYLPSLPVPDESFASSLYMIEPPNTILVRIRPQGASLCSYINKKLGYKDNLREVDPDLVRIGCIPTRHMTGYLFRYTREP